MKEVMTYDYLVPFEQKCLHFVWFVHQFWSLVVKKKGTDACKHTLGRPAVATHSVEER